MGAGGFAVVAPELAPPPPVQIGQGDVLLWNRRNSASLKRPNTGVTYTPLDVIGRDAANGGGLLELPNVANIGQSVRLRLLLTEQVSYGAKATQFILYTFTSKPKGAVIPDDAPFTLSAEDVQDALHIPTNPTQDGGGFPGITGQLGGPETHFVDDVPTVGLRGVVIPIDGIVMRATSLWFYLVALNAADGLQNVVYKFTPIVAVVGGVIP